MCTGNLLLVAYGKGKCWCSATTNQLVFYFCPCKWVQVSHGNRKSRNQTEGLRPQWYVSTMIYSPDVPFWSETLETVYECFKVYAQARNSPVLCVCVCVCMCMYVCVWGGGGEFSVQTNLL